MENISASDILELLDDTKKITSISVYGTKLIEHKAITGRLDIFSRIIKEGVTFQNCYFEDVIIHNTQFTDSIEFRQCFFSKDFRIIFLNTLNFHLQNCQFEKAFVIENCTLTYLTFDRVEAQNGIIIKGGQILLLDIKPINEKTSYSFTGMFLLIHTFSIISQSGITTYAKNCIINNINITGYLSIASRLDFNHIKNKKTAMYELNNSGKIYFSNLKPIGVQGFKDNPLAPYIEAYEKLHPLERREINFLKDMALKMGALEILRGHYPLFGFREYMEKNHLADFLVYLDSFEVRFHIHDSSPGILELKSIMLDRYQIEIINSDLSALKLLHARVPDVKAKDEYLNYYNVYNDLYTATVRQNNTKDKAFYYKIAQHYLYKHLKHESYLNGGDLGSRIAITASRIYSSHGTDWIRACIVTLLTTLIFFGLFTLSLNEINFDISQNGISFFLNTVLPFFPQFINPIHRLDLMSQIGSLGKWTALFDFISRIFVSIGIFEIIRSFRKHVRQ